MASRHLDIDCRKCGTFIVRYRKEGSGQLIRLYLDKVLQPKSLAAAKDFGCSTSVSYTHLTLPTIYSV